jgi:hypothetical protein
MALSKGELEDAEKAARAYARTHWGRRGNGKILTLPMLDPSVGVLTTLGILREVVYETCKGVDREPVLYEHEFSRRRPPLLVYHQGCQLLGIAGGEYKVPWRGIVR